MSKRALVGLILVLLIAGGLAWIYHNRPGTSFDLTPYNALGMGAARETAKLLGGNGGITIIIPEANANNPSLQGELEAFQKTIKKNGIASVKTVKFRLATPLEVIQTGGMLPREQLFSVLQSAARPGVVVLFCGFPFLPPQDCETVKQSGTKIIVVSAYQPNFWNLLKAHVIDLAIVPKSGNSAETAKKARTLQDGFESEFAVLTPENIEAFSNSMAN